jgi:S1-C subfamily serine protease
VPGRNLVIVKLQRFFGLGLWLAWVLTPEGLHAALTPETLYQKVLPSVMRLEVKSQTGEKFIGSAVLALADDVVLTAWHVVADASSVCAVFADGQRVNVIGCVDYDRRRDLALLKLETRLPHRKAALGRESPSVAARAYVIGSPKGYDFSITDGLISQIRSVQGFLQYQLSCPISPGNSGSPVLNQRGEVIGIASWTQTGAQNLSFAIPTQDFFGLNVFERPRTWAQLAATTRPPLRPSLVESRHDNDKVLEDRTDEGSYVAFSKRLKDSIGKHVTIILQEEERTNTFTFTVK